MFLTKLFLLGFFPLFLGLQSPPRHPKTNNPHPHFPEKSLIAEKKTFYSTYQEKIRIVYNPYNSGAGEGPFFGFDNFAWSPRINQQRGRTDLNYNDVNSLFSNCNNILLSKQGNGDGNLYTDGSFKGKASYSNYIDFLEIGFGYDNKVLYFQATPYI